MKNLQKAGVLAAALIMIISTVCGISDDDVHADSLSGIFSYHRLPINCWGDSMTYGQNGDGVSYPDILQELTGFEVNNYGISGNTTYQIMSRSKEYGDQSDDIMIIEMGDNGVWSDMDDLVSQYKEMINNANCSRYIIITSTDDPDDTSWIWSQRSDEQENYHPGMDDTYYEAAIGEVFGNHVLKARKYLIQRGLEINNLSPTTEDFERASRGCISNRLRHTEIDTTHLNGMGYKAQAFGVYEVGKELGYWFDNGRDVADNTIVKVDDGAIDTNYSGINHASDGDYCFENGQGIKIPSGIEFIYNKDYYLENNPDVFQAYGGDDALTLYHFLTYGMREGRIANPVFDPQYYRDSYPDLNAAFGDDISKYYYHFLNFGISESRRSSPVFDVVYYKNHYPDLINAFAGQSNDAYLRHFVQFGMKEGRTGSAEFDVDTYRNNYWDLEKAFGDDCEKYYAHFLKYGKNEGRNAEVQVTNVWHGTDYTHVFNAQYYADQRPDVVAIYGNSERGLLYHFVRWGMNEGTRASAEFDPHIYRLNYMDLNQAFGDDWEQYYLHYINNGVSEHRQADSLIKQPEGNKNNEIQNNDLRDDT